MHGIDTLKETINIGKDTIECPVLECKETVPRKRKGDKLEDCDITCPDCKIEIRSSTFIYPSKVDNLLWTDKGDSELLIAIEKFKRESRMENDNSEDAVTWNVFRYLDKTGHISEFVKHITGQSEEKEDLIYWSYSTKKNQQWSWLNKAHKIFGERDGRGSEPDMAIETDKSIIFIEAKFNSGNSTQPSNPHESLPKYAQGDNNWSEKVFKESLEEVALKRKRYELMRFWLLGSWIADQHGKDFYLVNLVRKDSRDNLETSFKPCIHEIQERPNIRLVKRVNWEEIYDLLEERNLNDEKLKKYFHNKISGIGTNGKVLPAFNLKS